MSKPIKEFITNELKTRLDGIEALAVFNPRGISAIQTNLFRRKLSEKGLRMMVVKNTLARRAVLNTKLEGFDKLLQGPSAVVYGKASIAAIARTLIDAKKENDKIELRGAFFDGSIYEGDAGVEQASKLPTREEAIANLIGALQGPGRKLAAVVKGPGGRLGGILKAIEEKAEKGGEAAPASAE